MRKILLCLLIILLCSASVAFGMILGGSNLDFMGYPEFNEYLSYNPSRTDIEMYVQKAKQYVENGNNDIQRIREAQDDAIRKANIAVDNYNSGY